MTSLKKVTFSFPDYVIISNQIYITQRMLHQQAFFSVVNMEEPQDEQTDGPSRSVTYDELEMAAFHNNQEFVQDWLNSNDQQICQWRGSLLSRAAYHHSVDVVKCITCNLSCGLSCNG